MADNKHVNYIAEFLNKNHGANIPDKSPSVKLVEIEEFVQAVAKKNFVDWEPKDGTIAERIEHLEKTILPRAKEVGAAYEPFRDYEARLEREEAERQAAEREAKLAEEHRAQDPLFRLEKELDDLDKRIKALEEVVAFVKRRGLI